MALLTIQIIFLSKTTSFNIKRKLEMIE